MAKTKMNTARPNCGHVWAYGTKIWYRRSMCPKRKYGMSTTILCRPMKRSMVVYPIRHPRTTCTKTVFLNSTAYGRHMLNAMSARMYQRSAAGVT